VGDKNSFSQTPFLFARPLLGFAKIFSEADEELFD